MGMDRREQNRLLGLTRLCGISLGFWMRGVGQKINPQMLRVSMRTMGDKRAHSPGSRS